MTTQPSPFASAAMGAVDAMRLFVNIAARPATKFTASNSGTGEHVTTTITFHSPACRGRLTRDQDGLRLAVTPDCATAPDFVPRILAFDRQSFARSSIMTTSSDDLLVDDGRYFAIQLAQLLADNHGTSQLMTMHGSSDHLFLIAPKNGADETKQVVEQLAQSIDVALGGLAKCVISYPALDVPGHCLLIDENDRIGTVPAEIADQVSALNTAARMLPAAIRFTQEGTQYPPTYEVYPHRHTADDVGDRSHARITGIFAKARAQAMANKAELVARYHAAIEVPSKARAASTLPRRAAAHFCIDWKRHMPDAPEPELISHKEVGHSANPDTRTFIFDIICGCQEAEQYNRVGRFQLIRHVQ